MKIRSTSTVLALMSVLWMATPSTASAQMGVLVGLNSANLKFDPEEEFKPERRAGFVAGLSFNVPLQDMFSVELDALFAQKGAKLSEGSDKAEIKLSYVDFPVMGRINVPGSGPVRVHLLAGPSFNFKVSEGFEENGQESDEEDQVEKFETALVIGGGLTVSRFRIDLRYGLGLSNIAKDSGSDKVKNRVFSVLVGFGA